MPAIVATAAITTAPQDGTPARRPKAERCWSATVR
jgi:hypothetical protein